MRAACWSRCWNPALLQLLETGVVGVPQAEIRNSVASFDAMQTGLRRLSASVYCKPAPVNELCSRQGCSMLAST